MLTRVFIVFIIVAIRFHFLCYLFIWMQKIFTIDISILKMTECFLSDILHTVVQKSDIVPYMIHVTPDTWVCFCLWKADKQNCADYDKSLAWLVFASASMMWWVACMCVLDWDQTIEFKLVESNQSSIQITWWRSVHYLLYSGDSRLLISPIPLPFPLNPQTVTADSSVSVKWSCVYVPLLVSTLLFWESWLWLAKHRGSHLDLFVLSDWLQSTLKIWNRWGILMWNCCTEPTDSLKSFKPCVHLCVLCCKLLFVWW